MKQNANSLFRLNRYGYCRWWNIPGHLVRICKMLKAIYWRAKYGFEPYDVWDLHNFLALLMHDSLTYFTNNLHGHPFNMNEYEWVEYLRRMAIAFKTTLEDENEESRELFDRWRKSYKETGDKNAPETKKLFNEYMVVSKEIEKNRRKEKDKAFDMLKEYFFDLWD